MEPEIISQPKKIPFKCPVCNGFGTVKYGELSCQACTGRGYVVIDQDEGYDTRRAKLDTLKAMVRKIEEERGYKGENTNVEITTD